jgi:hypothetical protein
MGRDDDPWGVLGAALGSTPATTALVAEIILLHEQERVVGNDRRRNGMQTSPN